MGGDRRERLDQSPRSGAEGLGQWNCPGWGTGTVPVGGKGGAVSVGAWV